MHKKYINLNKEILKNNKCRKNDVPNINIYKYKNVRI